MPRPTVDEDLENFIATLKSGGGSLGNQSLRTRLNWNEDRYWRTHGLLADNGAIVRGRGKGGSVSLVEKEPAIETAALVADDIVAAHVDERPELELYQPAKKVIEETWVRERAFDDHLVEVTALPGRRHTGGTWTRPDISVLATKAYPYLPGRTFELITFEVKTAASVDVAGVFEALSHAQFATMSYVLYCIAGKDFDRDFKDTQRVISIATQHGVGLIVASDVSQYASWDERVRPRRSVPDPEQANLFISTCFSETAKQRVINWHK